MVKKRKSFLYVEKNGRKTNWNQIERNNREPYECDIQTKVL